VAAQTPRLELGTRVRVYAPELGIERQSATFEALRGDTLVVVADSAMYCPLASVVRLDLYRGRGGHPWTGAALGFVAGAIAGGAAAIISCENTLCSVGPDVVLGGAGIGGLAGGLLGAGVGALIKTDRWEEVPLDQLRVSVAPRRDGLALTVTVVL
jgi:hypothetical protein